MSWENTGDFKTLDDIVAYGNARAEAERERIIGVVCRVNQFPISVYSIVTLIRKDAD
jgi:hypothetical protein